MWVAIAFGAIASVFVASAFNNFLSKFNVPYMALPFNLIITVIFLTLQPAAMDHLVKRDTSDLVGNNETISGNTTLMDHEDTDLLEADLEISWLRVGRGIVVSMGQVYAVNDVPASLVMHLAVLLSSPLLFVLSNTGAVIGSLLSLTFLPVSDYQQVSASISFVKTLFNPGVRRYLGLQQPSLDGRRLLRLLSILRQLPAGR